MKYRALRVAVVAFGLLLGGALAFAHHSITAEFDPSKTMVLKGTITQVDWENPHVYVHLDVKDDSGKIVNWALETYPPGVLHKGGVTRETFKPGQVVRIDAFPPKDGTKSLAYLKVITFSDGHSIEIWVGDPGQYK
jgi:Family of unknown function (DUF6152)